MCVYIFPQTIICICFGGLYTTREVIVKYNLGTSSIKDIKKFAEILSWMICDVCVIPLAKHSSQKSTCSKSSA